MIVRFPEAQMGQYLFDGRLLLNKSNHPHLALGQEGLDYCTLSQKKVSAPLKFRQGFNKIDSTYLRA